MPSLRLPRGAIATTAQPSVSRMSTRTQAEKRSSSSTTLGSGAMLIPPSRRQGPCRKAQVRRHDPLCCRSGEVVGLAEVVHELVGCSYQRAESTTLTGGDIRGVYIFAAFVPGERTSTPVRFISDEGISSFYDGSTEGLCHRDLLGTLPCTGNLFSFLGRSLYKSAKRRLTSGARPVYFRWERRTAVAR